MGSTNPEAISPLRSQQLSQARYERALLTEITKLQAAIVDERNIVTAQQRAERQAVQAEKERRASESDKASKLQAMEKAIEEAQKHEQKVYNRKVRRHQTHRRRLLVLAAHPCPFALSRARVAHSRLHHPTRALPARR